MSLLLSEDSINDFLREVYTPEVDLRSFLTLPIVELQLFAVYCKAFDLSICHKPLVKAAFAAIHLILVSQRG